MKRIIMSLAAIVFVAASAAGATGAFFTDTETSTGNTFTAGAIDLKVDSVQHYGNMICAATTQGGSTYEWLPFTGTGSAPISFDTSGQPYLSTAFDNAGYNTANPNNYPLAGDTCGGSWKATDLGAGIQKFFNFADIKPGDPGEDTVSLHIDNNPAWACADIKNVSNLENSITGPEAALSDTGPVGELAQNLQFVVWNDTNGNNILDTSEVVLTSGNAPTTNTTYTLADSTTGIPLNPGSDSHLGVAWCMGTFGTIPQGPYAGGALTCNGTAVTNIAQTDSYGADIAFRVEQSRNNSSFVCTPPLP